jgi:hypothetical protein
MHEDLEVRVAILETQIGRISSDIESEKGTRARINDRIMESLSTIDAAQRKTEKILWTGLGALGVLQFVIPLLFKS